MRNHTIVLALALAGAIACKDGSVPLPVSPDVSECALWALADFPRDYNKVSLDDAKRLAARLRGCSVVNTDAGTP
jgi:hypothetical protein